MSPPMSVSKKTRGRMTPYLLDLRGLARAAIAAFHPKTRAVSTAHRRTAKQLCATLGRQTRETLLGLPALKGAVLVSQMFSPSDVALQSVLLIAMRIAGYRPVVLIEARGIAWLERMYRLFGIKDFAYFEDELPRGRHPDEDAILDGTSSIDQIKPIVRHGIPVGTLALSTYMRRFRAGEVNISDAAQRERFRPFLSDSLRYADAMAVFVARWKPVAGITIDRGYTPQGHLFHALLHVAGTCFTLNSSHRSGALMLKRYRRDDGDQHPSSLAPDTWTKLKTMPWGPEQWRRLRIEIEDGYAKGEWYSAGGSQFRKRLVAPDELKSLIGLDPNKPTAVIFPHMFWDASFTWGRDLFDNYEDWFRQVLLVACRNENLNWIVKIHPANTTKNIRDGYKGEHSEIVVLREVCDPLPRHVFLLPPESDISTLSVYGIMDYCLTVRGTPGIEAPALGKVALTAGTGRYDGHGFTRDSKSPEEYLAKLERLHKEPPLSPQEVELARRFAYGVFMVRPTSFSTLQFVFQRDSKASVRSSFVLPPSGDIRDADDVRTIAAWIESGATDYLDAAVMRQSVPDRYAADAKSRAAPAGHALPA